MKEFFKDMIGAFESDPDFRVLMLSVGVFFCVLGALIFHVIFD